MISSGECGVTVTSSLYGTSSSIRLDRTICARRSPSPIACLGVDRSASASRLIGYVGGAVDVDLDALRQVVDGRRQPRGLFVVRDRLAVPVGRLLGEHVAQRDRLP